MPNTHDPQAQGRWVCGGPSQPACRGLMGLEEPWEAWWPLQAEAICFLSGTPRNSILRDRSLAL